VSDQPAEGDMVIESHKGPYRVRFFEEAAAAVAAIAGDNVHYIVDQRVAALHKEALAPVLQSGSVLRLEATEQAKSLERFPAYVAHLVANGLRRDQCLVAIGGGIIQDITCFLAANMLRGVDWRFIPTTLLAQADSCIGSKSSINAGGAKNILGTFTPPREIALSPSFLGTLDRVDLRSGIGEILKVHAIAGPDAYNAVARDYQTLFTNPLLLLAYIRRALEIKKAYIEIDEFDRKERNIFNYGHSFGHAIEAATDFCVPHGVAVTIGMDIANFIALRIGRNKEAFARMHPGLRLNYDGFEKTPVPLDAFLTALGKDKKNVGNRLTVILPDENDIPAKHQLANDAMLRGLCGEFLESVRAE
jgi:3-dehydroquinate synthase